MNNFIKIIPARAGHCTANYNLLFSPGMTDFDEFIHKNPRSCLLASCFEPTTLVEMTVYQTQGSRSVHPGDFQTPESELKK